ncbi:DoxX family membrane protein [Gordonia alkaliphila]|uniref:DoxX family protein n=1 Tax=Gordonia alkaliphila TaxID=1053547 RepID=UPI001FF2D119|nr:DoxX family protein [Gordonia alkaliphila]MCK0438018.1 DoxX family membrane protein [Gordonia alkaliphila]
MSSSDDARPARRPQPDRDSFYDKHARPKSRPAADPVVDDDVPATTIINTGDDDLPTVQIQSAADATVPDAGDGASDAGSSHGTVVAGSSHGKTVAGKTFAKDTVDEDTVDEDTVDEDTGTTETAAVRSTRTDVRSDSDTVVTEPFVDVEDDANDETVAAQKRRAAEHLTEEPLPYIEPQPTTPLDWDDVTAVPAAASAYADEPVAPVVDEHRELDQDADTAPVGRGTADLGLLILRVVVGIVFVMHGLQKLTTWTWLDGFGIDGFAAFLANTAPGADANLGFDPDVTRTLALLGGLTETIGGAFLILGLITPIAGSAVLGVILVATAYKMTLAGGVWFFTSQGGGGVEYEFVLAAAAVALILCGPGTYSFDRQWGWSRRPAWGSAAWLIIAIAAAVAVWVVFNGSNPLLVGA